MSVYTFFLFQKEIHSAYRQLTSLPFIKLDRCKIINSWQIANFFKKYLKLT